MPDWSIFAAVVTLLWAVGSHNGACKGQKPRKAYPYVGFHGEHPPNKNTMNGTMPGVR